MAGHADSIGYIIPAPVLRSVLQDFFSQGGTASLPPPPPLGSSSPPSSPKHISHTTLAGFAHLDLEFETLENPSKRGWLGLPEGLSGVYVTRVGALSRLMGVVREGDVLCHVEGQSISNSGKVKYGTGSPMDFRVYVTMKLVGQPLELGLFRRGKTETISTTSESQHHITPFTWYGDSSYCMFGGLVFVPASEPSDDYFYHSHLLWEKSGRKLFSKLQQVVILKR